MKLHRGTDRIACVGERYTVKIARSNPLQFFKYAHSIQERRGFRTVIDAWNASTADQHQSLKNLLLHGVIANRRERRLAEEGVDVVIPTASLLGGIINVQPTAPSTSLDEASVHSAFVEKLGPGVTALGHMLEDPNNLGVHNGSVKFVDGGSHGLERVMQTQPEMVEQALGSLALSPEARN